MWEFRWIWKHWKTWELIIVEYQDGGGIRGVYLGCLVIAYHYLDDDA